MIDILASEYGWQAVESLGFYDSINLLGLVTDRKRDNIMSMSIATQADPKELRKRLYENNVEKVKLDENGIEALKQKLGKRSQFKVK